MIFQKAIMNPREEKMVEYRNAQISNQQSLIEYIAVMSDIDLPVEEENTASMGGEELAVVNDVEDMEAQYMDDMELSTHGKKAKYYYDSGFWTKKMVYNVTKKGWITPEEYEYITDDKYI